MGQRSEVKDIKSATRAAWHLADQYLEDKDAGHNTCLDVMNGIAERNTDLRALLAKGTYDSKGNGNPKDIRPFTVTEICKIHDSIAQTEKTTIMIATSILKDLNTDAFTEFIRRTKAAGVMTLTENDMEIGSAAAAESLAKEGPGGSRLLPGACKKASEARSHRKGRREGQKA